MDSDLILKSAFVAYAFSLIVHQRTIREAFSMFVVAHLVAPILALVPIEWFAKGTGFLILSIGTILVGSMFSIIIILIASLFSMYHIGKGDIPTNGKFENILDIGYRLRC